MKRLLFKFLIRIKNDEILLYAQGLAFNTLLTLIPILGLLISIANIFIPQKTIINQFVVQLAKYLTAEATQKVVKVIVALITKLETFPLGKFSIIAYFLMSLGLLFELEEVLNKIFQSSQKRTLVQRITFFWLCMTITPALLFLPFSFYSYFGKLSKGIVFILIALFFFLMYIYFPAKKVAKKEALLGAVFSTVLWGFSSYLYSIYIKYAIGYSKIYGSLAAVPLFLIWIFLNWTIFLIGAEIVVFLEEKGWKIEYWNLPVGITKLYLLYKIAEGFKNKRIVKIKDLVEDLKTSPIFVMSLLEDLEKKGYIYFRGKELLLTHTPEKMKVLELLEIPESPQEEELPQPLVDLVARLKKLQPKQPFALSLEDILSFD